MRYLPALCKRVPNSANHGAAMSLTLQRICWPWARPDLPSATRALSAALAIHDPMRRHTISSQVGRRAQGKFTHTRTLPRDLVARNDSRGTGRAQQVAVHRQSACNNLTEAQGLEVLTIPHAERGLPAKLASTGPTLGDDQRHSSAQGHARTRSLPVGPRCARELPGTCDAFESCLCLAPERCELGIVTETQLH